jgi:hypothetical protein
MILATGVALVIALLPVAANLLGRDHSSSQRAFILGIGTHITRWESAMGPGIPRVIEVPGQAEVEIPAPTRSSFMAHWAGVPGATGYLLDVSTDSSFTSHVDGYQDLDVGNVTGRVVTGLSRGTTYYYRIRSYDASGRGRYSEGMTANTEPTTGLTIHPTFDSSITGNPNAAAIEAMINRAIGIYESLFSDPITVQIRFRYATTAPDGTPLPQSSVGESRYVYYVFPWTLFINGLRAGATSSNDNVANATLPANALSTNINAASANGRALGFDTPPAMFSNGTVGNGGPYDGIVTLNSAAPFQFTRPTNGGYLDAQRAIEHEIDEAIGLGSRLGTPSNDLRPQDLFSWSSPGVRNITSSGIRYFSINGGNINIVRFNQGPQGDFGDWLSEPCPQAHPYVQNAFSCTGQFSDISATSPEGINLDVIGYDLVSAPATTAIRAAVADFNGDGYPDYVLRKASTHETQIWYLQNSVHVGSANGPTLPGGWWLAAATDFNIDTHPDYAIFKPVTGQTVIGYLSGATVIGAALGPTLPTGSELAAAADFNNEGYPDYVLYNANTGETAIWYLNNNVFVSAEDGPALPAGWSLIGVADFNGDGHPDFALFNARTGQTVIGYLSGTTVVGAAFGPTIPSGWALVAVADFNVDGHPDYLLYRASARQTAIAYMNDDVVIGAALGPTLPAGWSLIGQ